MESVAGTLFPDGDGQLHVDEKTWELPIYKHTQNNKTLVAYADLMAKLSWRTRITTRHRQVNDTLSDWEKDHRAFSREYLWKDACGHAQTKSWECLLPEAIARNPTSTCYAKVREDVPPADTDYVGAHTTYHSETVLFLIRDSIPSVGDLLHNLQHLHSYMSFASLVVVCPDDTHAELIRHQGFMFYVCPEQHAPENQQSLTSTNGYVLEVLLHSTDPSSPCEFTHTGYMDARFRTIADACSYYARHNPQMRAISCHTNYRSDWDPTTHCAYVVRHDADVHLTLPPFDPVDGSTVATDGKLVSIFSRWLK
jgi:hypothetical protein